MLKIPEYTKKKRKGNIGEAFVQYVLSSFCLVHKIDGSQDVGNDFICELIKEEYPTNILFYVQVKYWESKPQHSNIRKTIEYWKSSPIPVYLFWVKDEKKIPGLNQKMLTPKTNIPLLKYKRYTPIVHNYNKHKKEAFTDFNRVMFLRDLMVDYARCLYKKGMTTVIKQNDFSKLEKIPLGKNCLFIRDLIPKEYRKEIINNSWTNLLATASSLAVSPHRPSLELALETIQLTKKLFNSSIDAIIKYPSFINEINKIEKEIAKKLKKL